MHQVALLQAVGEERVTKIQGSRRPESGCRLLLIGAVAPHGEHGGDFQLAALRQQLQELIGARQGFAAHQQGEAAQAGECLAQREGLGQQVLFEPLMRHAQQEMALGQGVEALVQVGVDRTQAPLARVPDIGELSACQGEDQPAQEVGLRKRGIDEFQAFEREPAEKIGRNRNQRDDAAIAHGNHGRHQP